MKVELPKEPRTNRIRVLVQTVTDKGRVVGGKAGYEKGKHIYLYDTSVADVYEVVLKALIAASNSDRR